MSCSCSSGLQAYVRSSPSSTIKTTGRVIGSRSLGHFGTVGKYVPATERSYITTPGPVEGVPNATGGMHLGPHSRLTDGGLSGFMEENFGLAQKNWIPGVANEYVAAGAALILLLAVMK